MSRLRGLHRPRRIDRADRSTPTRRSAWLSCALGIRGSAALPAPLLARQHQLPVRIVHRRDAYSWLISERRELLVVGRRGMCPIGDIPGAMGIVLAVVVVAR